MEAPMKFRLVFLVYIALAFAVACQKATRNTMEEKQTSSSAAHADPTHDVHSYSNPEQIRVKHVDLDLETNFDRKILHGTATLTVERIAPSDLLKLDTR